MIKLKVRISFDEECNRWLAVSKNFEGLFAEEETYEEILDTVQKLIPDLLGVTIFDLIIDQRKIIHVR